MNSSNATVTVLTGSSSRAASREHSLEINGWTARRREVIERDSGVCALCGREAADTASHSPELGDLVAAHTRCLVGLGPPVNFAMAA
jgi:5-methylcytosine-specific restriction endonuclease McrA